MLLLMLMFCCLLVSCGDEALVGADGRPDRAAQQLASAKTEAERFYALGDSAKQCFVHGKIADAQKRAEELITMLPRFQGNWNYGNAV
jgi:hypothetical protein